MKNTNKIRGLSKQLMLSTTLQSQFDYYAHALDKLRDKLQTCQNNALRFVLNLSYHIEMTEQ